MAEIVISSQFGRLSAGFSAGNSYDLADHWDAC